MQNTSNAPASAPQSPTWVATYGALILSLLAILVLAVAWITGRVDTNTAIATIGAILAANGLVSATQWQAAPGLVSQMQSIIGQLTSHIQTLHAQQVAQIATTKLPAVQQPASPQMQIHAPVRTSTPALTQQQPSQPLPQQAYASPASSFSSGLSLSPAALANPPAGVNWQQQTYPQPSARPSTGG